MDIDKLNMIADIHYKAFLQMYNEEECSKKDIFIAAFKAGYRKTREE